MSARTCRACDACRFRKVRCSGSQPCSHCAHLALKCEFSPVNRKRKPGTRGHLVAQLRGKANASNSPATLAPRTDATVAVSENGPTHLSPASDNTNSTSPITLQLQPQQRQSPWSITALTTNDHDYAQYATQLFLDLLPDFEQVVYPVNPILLPEEIRVAIHNRHDSHEDAALVFAFAGVTINLSQTSSWTLHGEVASKLTELVQASLVFHRKADIAGLSTPGRLDELPINLKRVVTCIFLEICMMAFKRFDRSLTILREAMAMIQVLETHSNNQPQSRIPIQYRPAIERAYWEVFIHERFLTMAVGHPAVLPPLSSGLPICDTQIPSNVDLGFKRLIHIFRIIDDTFISHWTISRSGSRVPGITAEWIESKQAQLDQDEVNAAESEQSLINAGEGGLTELQHADIFVTRLWLRTLVWQLALSQGLLRSNVPTNTHEGLSLHFPVQRLSAQLRSLVTRLGSVASIGTHGSGILQKLFEITSTVSDVLALPRGYGQSQEEVMTRMQDFVFLVQFMFSFERMAKQERDYLREKLEVLQPLYTKVDFRGLAGASPV